MQNWDSFKELINGDKKKFVVCTHTNPDADAIGSSLAWATYLEKKGHEATVIVPNECPNNLRWMSNYGRVVTYEGNPKTKKQAAEIINNADLICCLDFNALGRIKEVGKLVEQSNAKRILIDHHLEPEIEAEYRFSDTTKAATAEYVFDIIERLGDAELIDESMAACLYAGIMTDTGSFRHNSTTPAVHQTVAKLMTTGLAVNRVHRLIFDNNSVGKIKLLGHVLGENLTVLPEFRTAYMTISEEELKKYGSNMGDTDGIVNYGLEIENVVMAVLMIERKDEIKLSFRSVGEFSVRELASAHFEGGGHFNASGGRTDVSLNKTVEKLLNILPEYKEKLLKIVK